MMGFFIGDTPPSRYLSKIGSTMLNRIYEHPSSLASQILYQPKRGRKGSGETRSVLEVVLQRSAVSNRARAVM